MYTLRTAVVFIVGLLVLLSTMFFILRVLSGDPALLAMPKVPMEVFPVDTINEIQDVFAEPLASQYVHFIGDMLSGEFYYSYMFRTDVSEFVYDYMWRTVALFVSSLTISLLLGIVYGYLSARRRTHVGRQLVSLLPLAAFSSSILAVVWMCTRFLVVDPELFPFGYPSIGIDDDSLIVDLLGPTQLAYSILPVLIVVFVSTGAFALIVRDGYVVGGRVNTPSSKRPSYGSDGMFISLPNLQLFAAFVMCCVIVVEVFLEYRGLGFLLVMSITWWDYFVIQATVFLAALLVLMANIVVYVIVTLLRQNRCLDHPCCGSSAGHAQVHPADGRVPDCKGTSTPSSVISALHSLVKDYLRSPVGLTALIVFVALVGIAVAGTQASILDFERPHPTPYDPLSLFLAGAVAPVSFTLLGGVIALAVGALLGIPFGLTSRYTLAPVQGLFVGIISTPMVCLIAICHYAIGPSYWGGMLRLSLVISLPIAILIGHGLVLSERRSNPSRNGPRKAAFWKCIPATVAWGLNGLKYGLVAALSTMFACDFLSVSGWESWGRSVEIAYEWHLMYTPGAQGGWDYVLPAFAGMFLLLSSVFLILDTTETVVRRRYGDA
jgi:ABC-type dipeptide/oligopeptide/nickel transport system permease component